MRSIRIDFGPDAVDAATAISDVSLAAALLAGAASKAEAALSNSVSWSPDALAAAGPLEKIIKAANEFEAALAGRARMPSPANLKTIAKG
jgi:hypothetical protein